MDRVRRDDLNDDALFAPISREESREVERVSDDLIDAYFDDELSEQQTKQLFKALKRQPAKAREVVATEQMLAAMRRPIHAPDLAKKILRAVDREKSWLNRFSMRKVAIARYAAAAAVLALVGGAFIVQRMAPEATTFAAQEQPISGLVSAVAVDTVSAVHNLPAHVTTVGRFVLSPVEVCPAPAVVACEAREECVSPYRPDSSNLVFVGLEPRASCVREPVRPAAEDSSRPSLYAASFVQTASHEPHVVSRNSAPRFQFLPISAYVTSSTQSARIERDADQPLLIRR